MKLTTIALALSLVFSVAASTVRAEEEHGMGTLKGPRIDLKAYDHAIAGEMKGFLLWGALDEAVGGSELIMKKDGQLIKATFKRENNRFGGVIRHTVDSKVIETTLQLVKIDRKLAQITLSVDGREVVVSITADRFENNHFINPTYRATIGGESFEYVLQGKACYNFSTHLAFLVLGAYLH